MIELVANLDLMAEPNKAERRSKFLGIENNIKKWLQQNSASSLNETVSTKLKLDSTKTNVSRVRKKQTQSQDSENLFD